MYFFCYSSSLIPVLLLRFIFFFLVHAPVTGRVGGHSPPHHNDRTNHNSSTLARHSLSYHLLAPPYRVTSRRVGIFFYSSLIDRVPLCQLPFSGIFLVLYFVFSFSFHPSPSPPDLPSAFFFFRTNTVSSPIQGEPTHNKVSSSTGAAFNKMTVLVRSSVGRGRSLLSGHCVSTADQMVSPNPRPNYVVKWDIMLIYCNRQADYSIYI